MSLSMDMNIELKLSKLLLGLILARHSGFKKPVLKKWSLYIDRMIRLDKRKPNDIEAVIKWCQADEFWQNNILSTRKLRDKFDQLYLKMPKKVYIPSSKPHYTTLEERKKADDNLRTGKTINMSTAAKRLRESRRAGGKGKK